MIHGFKAPISKGNLPSQRSRRGKSKKRLSSTKGNLKKENQDFERLYSSVTNQAGKDRGSLKPKQLQADRRYSGIKVIEDDPNKYSTVKKAGKNISYKSTYKYRAKRNSRINNNSPSYTKPKRSFRKSEHVRKSKKEVKIPTGKAKSRVKRKSAFNTRNNGGTSAKKLYTSPNKTAFTSGFDSSKSGKPKYKSPGKQRSGTNWYGGKPKVKPKPKKDMRKMNSMKYRKAQKTPSAKSIHNTKSKKIALEDRASLQNSKAKRAKSTKAFKSQKTIKSKTSGDEFVLNSDTTDREGLSMTYGARSELSGKKSAMTVIRESQIKRDKNKDNLIRYLLEERKGMMEKFEAQKQELDVFKKEVRRVKTLSQYYPNNNELIIEESDKGSSSYESSEENKKIMIASSQDLKISGYSNKSGGTNDPLRQSNHIPLRQTMDPLRSSNNPLMASQDPFRQTLDPLRSSMPMKVNFDPLRGTNFSAPNLDPLRSTNYSSPPLTAKADSVYTTKLPENEKASEFRRVSDTFMQHLARTENEEIIKFGEFTFRKIESIVQDLSQEVVALNNKNLNLMGVITDMRIKDLSGEKKLTKDEAERLITEFKDGKIDGNDDTNTLHCDWETVDKQSDLPLIDSKNNAITIPDNLKRFGISGKPINKLQSPEGEGNMSERDLNPSPNAINWESKSSKSVKDKKLSINSQDLFEFSNGTFTFNLEKTNKLKNKQKAKNYKLSKNNSAEELPLSLSPSPQAPIDAKQGSDEKFTLDLIKTGGQNSIKSTSNSSKLNRTNNFKYFFMSKRGKEVTNKRV